MSTFAQIARFVRWQDWGPSKITVLWSVCLYIAVAYDLTFDAFLLTFVVFMVFAATQAALGYVINDWGDRSLDRRTFKHNAFTGKSPLECILALTLIAITAFLSGLPLILRPGFGILWLAWVAAAASYSLEPIRMKTKGVIGLIMSSAACWFLPVLITFAAFDVAGGIDMWIIAAALTLTGITLEIAHQRNDRTRDKLMNAETFAARRSDNQVDEVYTIALLFDKLAIGLIVAATAFALEKIDTWWSSVLAIILAITYCMLLFMSVVSSYQAQRAGTVEDPYYGNRYPIARFFHITLINFVLPVILGLAAALQAPLYAFVLGLFLVWRVLVGGVDWLWPLRTIKIRSNK